MQLLLWVKSWLLFHTILVLVVCYSLLVNNNEFRTARRLVHYQLLFLAVIIASVVGLYRPACLDKKVHLMPSGTEQLIVY